MAGLKTDYKDDVLDTTQNTKRKYQMIDNGDGTVSFEDVTEYIQQGDSFGADDINDTNEEVNTINDNLTKTSITILKTENSHLKNDVIVEKWGKVVNIAIRGLQTITPKNATTLFTLPEAYRPEVSKQYEFITVSDDERYTILVATNGEVKFYDYSNTAYHVDTLNMTLSYII